MRINPGPKDEYQQRVECKNIYVTPPGELIPSSCRHPLPDTDTSFEYPLKPMNIKKARNALQSKTPVDHVPHRMVHCTLPVP